MNDLPEATFAEIKLSPKKASVRMTAPRVREYPQCAEGEEIKQQYDSALDEWSKHAQPQLQVRPFFAGEASARRAFELREEALAKRNAAANQMYLHRASCATCRRRR